MLQVVELDTAGPEGEQVGGGEPGQIRLGLRRRTPRVCAQYRATAATGMRASRGNTASPYRACGQLGGSAPTAICMALNVFAYGWSPNTSASRTRSAATCAQVRPPRTAAASSATANATRPTCSIAASAASGTPRPVRRAGGRVAGVQDRGRQRPRCRQD